MNGDSHRDTTVYFNPSCSKCRTAQALLADQGVDATIVRYLETAPTVGELRHLMDLLGIVDPRHMIRAGEPVYSELDLGRDGLSAEELLDAIAAHPVLLERPIVVVGDRAVIARPAERLLEIL